MLRQWVYVDHFCDQLNLTTNPSYCRLEASEAECKRQEARLTLLQSEIERLQGEMAGDRNQDSIDLQTKAQHAELLRKVEQINLLTDSNRMLRQEKDAMQPTIDELRKQVYHYQNSYRCTHHSRTPSPRLL